MRTIKNLCRLALTAAIFLYPIFAYSAPNDAALLATAQKKGSVRLIVRLDMNYKMESLHAAEQAVQNQRQDISRKQDEVFNQISAHQVSGIKRYATVPYMAMVVDEHALQALINNPNIINIEEDIAYGINLAESKPQINADDVHTQGYDGSGLAIVILDTGVRKTHWDLDDGKVISEACYSTTSDNYTTLCPNGLSSQVGSGAGVNCDTALTSSCSHGTHVSGIAAGTWNGIAPGADIIAMQVFSINDNAFDCSPVAAPCVRTFASDQMLALERVYALRNTYAIASVNMSLGGGAFSSYCDNNSRKPIIDSLRSVGIATVIGSGNDGFDGWVGAPACISSAVTVGATLDNADTLANYSNHATMVDVLAPGSSIFSSIASGDTAYAEWDGTSMATPHVAGAFALIREKRPSWSVDFIESRLKSTGVNVTRSGVTKPRIDVLEAIKSSDMVVLNTSVSDNVVNPQQTITITTTAKNQGEASASGFTTLRYYQSSNSTISNIDTQVDTDQVSVLSPGSTSSLISTAITVPQITGSYYYGACVDAQEGEAPTNNNCSPGIEVLLTAFDYEVQSPAVSNDELLPGQSFTLSASVVNNGNVLSPSTTLRYYRSSDSTITTGDSLEGTDAVPNLPGLGGQSVESIVLTAPTGGGLFYYGACVDTKNLELSTVNNCSAGVPIAASSLPDLTVVSPAVDNDTVLNGESFTFSATATNIGGTNAFSFVLRYLRSTDPFITLNDTNIGFGSLGGLNSGQSKNFTKVINTSGTSPDTYYYGVCAVPTSNNELRTDNNCSTGVQVTITAPDLIVPSFTVSSFNLNPGQSFSFSSGVYNQGDATAASTTLRYYRSLDPTISDEDKSLGTASISSLNPGISSGQKTIQLTAPATGGDYYYGACVDAVAGELDIADNCLIGVPITVFITADSYESDDSNGLASTIDNGSPQTHNIHVVGDADWLKFTVTEAVTDIEINITGGGSDETRLTLFDGGLEEVAFNGVPGSHALIALAALDAGTYYILVNENGNDKTIGSYSISLTYTEAYSSRKFCFPAKSSTGDDVYICLH